MENQTNNNQDVQTVSIDATNPNVIDIQKTEKKAKILSYTWKIALLVYTLMCFARVPFVASYTDGLFEYILGEAKYLFYGLMIFIEISMIFNLPTMKVIKTPRFVLIILLILFLAGCMVSSIADLVAHFQETRTFKEIMEQFHGVWKDYFLNWHYSGFANTAYISGGILAVLVSYVFNFLSYVILFIVALVILVICVFAIFNINYRSTTVGLKLRGWLIRKLGGTFKHDSFDELRQLKDNQNKPKKVSNRLIEKMAKINEVPPFELLPATDLNHYKENFKKARNIQAKLEKLFKESNIKLTFIQNCVYTTYSEICFETSNLAYIKQVLNIQDKIAKAIKMEDFNITIKDHIICIEYSNMFFSKVSLRSASVIFDRRKYFSSFFALNKTNQLITQNFKEEPSALIVGKQGSGSATLTILMILSMCYAVKPQDLDLVILNTAAEINYLNFTKLPHSDGKDYDDINLSGQKLQAIYEEMKQRASAFASLGAENIDEYNQKVKDPKQIMKHKLLLITNFTNLIKDSINNQEIIHTLLVDGGKLGIFVVLHSYDANNDVLDDKIYKEVARKYILKLSTETESQRIFESARGIQLHGYGDCLTFAKLTRFMERIQICNINQLELAQDVDVIKTFYSFKEGGNNGK